MKFRFSTPSERTRCHRYIREAAFEIEESTPLALALFRLENGCEQNAPTGFGFTDLEAADAAVVQFQKLDDEQVDTIIERLEAATAADLGDADDDQLATIAEYLSDAAEMLQDARPSPTS